MSQCPINLTTVEKRHVSGHTPLISLHNFRIFIIRIQSSLSLEIASCLYCFFNFCKWHHKKHTDGKNLKFPVKKKKNSTYFKCNDNKATVRRCIQVKCICHLPIPESLLLPHDSMSPCSAFEILPTKPTFYFQPSPFC